MCYISEARSLGSWRFIRYFSKAAAGVAKLLRQSYIVFKLQGKNIHVPEINRTCELYITSHAIETFLVNMSFIKKKVFYKLIYVNFIF